MKHKEQSEYVDRTQRQYETANSNTCPKTKIKLQHKFKFGYSLLETGYSRRSNNMIRKRIPRINNTKLEGKYSLESTDPRESEIRALRQLTIALKPSCYLFIIAKLFKVKDGCLKFVYIGKKSPVYSVFGQ